MIISRLESLIAGAGIDDALNRAKIYIDAGADAVMIHSKEKDGKEIADFLKRFREFAPIYGGSGSYILQSFYRRRALRDGRKHYYLCKSPA